MTTSRAPQLATAARALVIRSTSEQGLPQRVRDPSILATVALLLERSHEDDVVAGVDGKRVTA